MPLLRYGHHSVLKGAPCRALRLLKISTCIFQFIFNLILVKMARSKRCELFTEGSDANAFVFLHEG